MIIIQRTVMYKTVI